MSFLKKLDWWVVAYALIVVAAPGAVVWALGEDTEQRDRAMKECVEAHDFDTCNCWVNRRCEEDTP